MDGYTGAEIEGVIGKAAQLHAKRPASTIFQALQEAFDRIIPSMQDIDRMTRLALMHCNDLDLVPAHFRELARVVRKPASHDEEEAEIPNVRRSRKRDL
jgi:hypothetical protein